MSNAAKREVHGRVCLQRYLADIESGDKAAQYLDAYDRAVKQSQEQ